MLAYLVELDDVVKVGVSANIESRLKCYKHKKRFITKEIQGDHPETKSRFIELGMMDKFDSETEYLSGVTFDNALSYFNELFKILPDKTFYFRPLDIDVIYNSDGYIDLQLISDYVNTKRVLKGKPLARLDKYTYSKATKMFADSIEKRHNKKAFMTKRGMYGGSFALPMVVLDYIAWSDVDLKIKVYEYMYSNIEYVDFMNLSKDTLESNNGRA